MSKNFAIDADFSELEAQLDQIGKSAGEFARPAAYAGASVLYSEARFRAPVSKSGHWFYGTHQKYWIERGTLKNSIYHVYSKDNSTDGKRATYHISWNYKKAPHGFMVEYGTSRAPAHPFLRPAYDAVKDLSLTVAKDRFVTLMEGALNGASK